MNMTTDVDFYSFADMSVSEFAQFGLAELAYVKQIEEKGGRAIGVFAADGTPLAVLEDYAEAVALVAQNDLVNVTLH